MSIRETKIVKSFQNLMKQEIIPLGFAALGILYSCYIILWAGHLFGVTVHGKNSQPGEAHVPCH